MLSFDSPKHSQGTNIDNTCKGVLSDKCIQALMSTAQSMAQSLLGQPIENDTCLSIVNTDQFADVQRLAVEGCVFACGEFSSPGFGTFAALLSNSSYFAWSGKLM